jgi:hypothetical protein
MIPGPRDLIRLESGAEVGVVVVLAVLSIVFPLRLSSYFPLPYQYHVSQLRQLLCTKMLKIVFINKQIDRELFINQ